MRIGVRLSSLLLLVWMIVGCASTTLPGQIGLTRNQLLIVPSARVDAMAGETYAKQTTAARTAGKLNNDEAMTNRVKGIAGRLIAEVGAFRLDARAWDWQVNVIDSNDLNAFCLPGGKIGVYSGLIRRLELNDAEIAGVIGHEIGHALREHGREKVSQQVLSNAVVQGIASSGAKNSTTAALLADVGAQLFLHLPFSRDMEVEADSMGLELAARAGYDPLQAANVWQKMRRQEGSGSKPEFLSTHPSHDRRIIESELIAQKVLAVFRSPSNAPQVTQAVLPSQAIVQPVSFTSPNAAVVPASRRVVLPLDDPGGASKPRTVGQDTLIAETLAKSQACNAEPRGSLTEKGPGFENFDVSCSNGSTMKIRCEFGNCKVLK